MTDASLPREPSSISRRLLLQSPVAALGVAPVRALWSAMPVVSTAGALSAGAPSAMATPVTASLAHELRQQRLPSDALKVEFPPLADSGLAVPYAVEVASPAGRRLRQLDIFATQNPSPLALRMKLLKPQAEFRLNTRLRLASSQEVWVVATFDDGSQQAAGAATLVMASACLDES